MKFSISRTKRFCKKYYTFLIILLSLTVYLASSLILFSNEEYILRRLEGPIKPDYPELLDYIRNEILIPPSKEDYNILRNDNPANKAIEESEIFYTNVSDILFKNKYRGFFVEAGALDGESMSNTLSLEMDYVWDGLLVEADSQAFEAMVEKRRKAWLANVCLSPTSYPEKKLFASRSQYLPSKKFSAFGYKMRAMNGLASHVTPKLLTNSWFKVIQCLPLESLLLAMNVSRVDLLSLDVEGAEKDVLSTFPLDKFNVQVIYLEWKDSSTFDSLSKLLKSKAYTLYRKLNDDSVFIRNDSEFMQKGFQ